MNTLSAEILNANSQSALLDRHSLEARLQAQGIQNLVEQRCPHLFAEAPVFISARQMQQMRAIIDAAEQVVKNPQWTGGQPASAALGVFYGYDFHLNAQGAHLIEINTNAGGGFLSALLLQSQHDSGWPGIAMAQDNLQQVFLDMYQNEWRLAGKNVPLNSIAIVDTQPEEQYLYPEFLLALQMFEQAGIAAYITDPAALQLTDEGLYLDKHKIDLVYNRLTDFSLRQHPILQQAYLENKIVLTPDPSHYARYADKRNLAELSDAAGLAAIGVAEPDIDILQKGLPQTRLVDRVDQERWWQERKLWFFKPATGYGSKGSYNGAKLTRRVFDDIMQGGYIAQRLALPGVRSVGEVELKYDVRCYVYNGQVQLVMARLYQGQTTNFRTPGGGFAAVYQAV